MPWLAKPPITKYCRLCSKEVTKKRSKFNKKFKYCSNACKWLAKKKQVPHNKIKEENKIYIKCAVEFCNKVKYLTPFWFHKRKVHFCSVKCHHYYVAKKYKLDLKTLQEKREEVSKRNIWKIGFM